jgi:hypothetical protein
MVDATVGAIDFLFDKAGWRLDGRLDTLAYDLLYTNGLFSIFTLFVCPAVCLISGLVVSRLVSVASRSHPIRAKWAVTAILLGFSVGITPWVIVDVLLLIMMLTGP